ncbi:MAG: DUF4339 domain-containing protein [Pseudohongiellaceae bacterium]
MPKIFYTDGVKEYGPFSKDQLKNQNITRDTKIWFYGLDKWTEISNVPELNDIAGSIPPAIRPANSVIKQEESDTVTPSHENKTLEHDRAKISGSAKWLIGIIALLIILVSIDILIPNSGDNIVYNEIASNAYSADENFEMYVEKFYRDAEYFGIYLRRPKQTIIMLSKLDQMADTTHIHGLSFGSDDDEIIEIYVNQTSWDAFDKPMRYYLMYHELAHDVLNLDHVAEIPANEGRIMYPGISSYENKNMDDFIENSTAMFLEFSENNR